MMLFIDHIHDSNDELTRILNRVVDVGIRGGWEHLDDTPLRVAQVQVLPEPSTNEAPIENVSPTP